MKVEGDEAYVGITDYAQESLGNIVYVDMPEVDDEFAAEDDFGAVESVKAASDLVSPVSGTVVEVNEALEDQPELINQDAFGNWIMKVKLSDKSELDSLMDAKAYEEFCAKFRDFLNPDDDNDSRDCWGHYLWPGIRGVYKAQCLTRRLTVIPQLFYGTIYAASDATKNPVIGYDKYVENDKAKTTLTGTLYRGMAEVVVNIKSKHYSKKVNTEWYCLLADNVLTKTKLTSYDDFKKGDKGTYTAVACQKFVKEGDMVTLKAYLLPAKTRLAVRVIFDKDPWILNGKIKAKDVVSSETATGVIEVDALNDVFYLRRNHKYVLTYDDQEVLLNKEHQME